MYDVSCTNSSCLLIETSVTACLLIIMMNNKESPHRIDLNGHLAPLAKQKLLQFSICPSRGAEVNVRKKLWLVFGVFPPSPTAFSAILSRDQQHTAAATVPRAWWRLPFKVTI